LWRCPASHYFTSKAPRRAAAHLSFCGASATICHRKAPSRIPSSTQTTETAMPHAIRIHETGGPEKMQWEEVEVGAPGPGEVRVRNTAVGLNFIDTYHRSGLYPMQLPLSLGMEGAGVVEAVGRKVSDFKVGDRVAYANPIGSYSDVCLRPAERLVKIPAGVDDKVAAAIMLKGMTAWYLIHRTYKVKAGDTILMH